MQKAAKLDAKWLVGTETVYLCAFCHEPLYTQAEYAKMTSDEDNVTPFITPTVEVNKAFVEKCKTKRNSRENKARTHFKTVRHAYSLDNSHCEGATRLSLIKQNVIRAEIGPHGHLLNKSFGAHTISTAPSELKILVKPKNGQSEIKEKAVLRAQKQKPSKH